MTDGFAMKSDQKQTVSGLISPSSFLAFLTRSRTMDNMVEGGVGGAGALPGGILRGRGCALLVSCEEGSHSPSLLVSEGGGWCGCGGCGGYPQGEGASLLVKESLNGGWAQASFD